MKKNITYKDGYREALQAIYGFARSRYDSLILSAQRGDLNEGRKKAYREAMKELKKKLEVLP